MKVDWREQADVAAGLRALARTVEADSELTGGSVCIEVSARLILGAGPSGWGPAVLRRLADLIDGGRDGGDGE